MGFTALCDYVASELAWKKHEETVVKYTGFRNGVYISPEKLKKMKAITEKNLLNANKIINIEEDYFDDEK